MFSTAVETVSDEHGRSAQDGTFGVHLTHVLTKLLNSYSCGFGRHGHHVFLKLARITPEIRSRGGRVMRVKSHPTPKSLLDVELAEVRSKYENTKHPPKFTTDVERSVIVR